MSTATASATATASCQTIVKQFSPNLFWDIDIAELDMEKHIAYIVSRVLDYGRWEDWLLIRKYYGLEKIKETAMNLRFMFPDSLSFIATITHTHENQFRCYKQIQSKKIHLYC
jgi:hypothetical protein